MTFTLLSAAILGITAAIVYRKVKYGYKHGLSRSLISLAILIFCAVFASVISVIFAKGVGDLLMTFVTRMYFYKVLEAKIGVFVSAFGLLLKMLLSLIFYIPVFYLLKLAVTIVFGIILRALVKKGKKKVPQYNSEDELYHTKNDKKLGAFVGVLSGFVVAIVVFMPLTGLLRSADSIMDIVRDKTEIAAIENSKGVALLDKYANDAAGTVLNACGGNVLYNLTARTSISGETTYINREIEIIGDIDLVGLKNKFKTDGAINDENAEVIETLLNDTGKSLTMKLMLVDILKNASTNWLENKTYFGISKPNFGKHKALDSFSDSVLFVCTTTTIETYDDDIRTIINLIRIFREYKSLYDGADYDTFMKDFVEANALARVDDELYKNPHMNSVHGAVDDLIMNVIAMEIDDSKYSDTIKNRLYTGLAATMRDSQGLSGSVKAVAVSNGVSEHFENAGIYMPETLNNRVGDILTRNIATVDGKVTPNVIEEFFTQYLETDE